MDEEDKSTMYVHWMVCSQCDYDVAATGQVKCPECGCGMTPVATAGAILAKKGDRNA